MANFVEDCVRQREGFWHVARGIGNEDFQPILCSRDEGIVAPGRVRERVVTCPECVEILEGRRDSRRAAHQPEGEQP
jgi:hypothetical protein